MYYSERKFADQIFHMLDIPLIRPSKGGKLSVSHLFFIRA